MTPKKDIENSDEDLLVDSNNKSESQDKNDLFVKDMDSMDQDLGLESHSPEVPPKPAPNKTIKPKGKTTDIAPPKTTRAKRNSSPKAKESEDVEEDTEEKPNKKATNTKKETKGSSKNVESDKESDKENKKPPSKPSKKAAAAKKPASTTKKSNSKKDEKMADKSDDKDDDNEEEDDTKHSTKQETKKLTKGDQKSPDTAKSKPPPKRKLNDDKDDKNKKNKFDKENIDDEDESSKESPSKKSKTTTQSKVSGTKKTNKMDVEDDKKKETDKTKKLNTSEKEKKKPKTTTKDSSEKKNNDDEKSDKEDDDEDEDDDKASDDYKKFICFSGFDGDQVDSLKDHIQKIDSVESITSDELSEITHLLYKDGSGKTLKLLNAISKGIWVLDRKWIIKSLAKGKWEDEANYEVSEPVGCKQSRQAHENNEPGIFDGLTIMLHGKCDKTQLTVQKKTDLIKNLGGTVTKQIEKADLLITVTSAAEIPKNKPKNIPVVDSTWLIESIISFEKKDYKDFPPKN